MREFPISIGDRLPKRLPQDPAELAGTLLALAKAAMMMQESQRRLDFHSNEVVFAEIGRRKGFGLEAFDLPDTEMLMGVSDLEEYLATSKAETVRYYGDFERYESDPPRSPYRVFIHSTKRPGLRHVVQQWNQLHAHLTPLMLLRGPDTENVDEAFNRAAEFLSTRRRVAEVNALGRYVSRMTEAEQALNKAESERRLAQAFQNRRSMTALMSGDWLGLRVLYELSAAEAVKFSDLTGMTGGDTDLMAVIVAQLLAAGMVEARGNLFACSRKGAQVLQNLESAASSGHAEVAVHST